MKINLAQHAGFCPGVLRAVSAAEKLLDQVPDPIMLGEIVHNKAVVDELKARGFLLLEDSRNCPPGSTVLIRAHGIRKEDEDLLREQSCQLVDCTCQWVKKIHHLAERSANENSCFILAGTAGHPEVQGILSRAGHFHYLLQSAEDAEKIHFPELPAILCAQTTFSVREFQAIQKILNKKIAKLEIFDTICSTTTLRQTEADKLAENSDLVLVLGNRNSSNTQKLFSVCQRRCSETFLIQRPDQVPELLEGRDLRQLRIGITAGASTPERMIREVIQVMTENQIFSAEQEANEELKQTGAEETTGTTEEGFDFPQQDAQNSGENESSAEEEKNSEAESKQEETKDINFADFIEGIPQLKRGAIVKGTIVRYDDDFVYVDVRDKSEGKVPRSEFLPDFDFDEAIANHEQVEVYVRNIKNSDMGKEITLSKAKVDFSRHKEIIQKAFEEKTPITVKVTNVVKDGVIANFGNVDLYIHRTQLDFRVVENLDEWLGKSFDVLVTQFDPNRRRLRVSASRRSLLSRERRKKSKELWDSIEIGKEYDGIVRSITDFGAFVDIGGVDGLVHVSELSWKRIKHPSEVVKVGDKLRVFVKDFDKENHRISLGYRRPENDPYRDIEERFPVGSIVRGIVVRMFPFGAFIEIAPGLDALCHISQISNYHLNRPDDVLQEGMEIDARVLEVSNADRKISLSIKEVEPIDPEHPEELQKQQPRRERRQDDGEDQAPRRRPRREGHEDHDNMPTAYTDTASGSSLSTLANITVSSKEGEELLSNLGIAPEEDAKEETEE